MNRLFPRLDAETRTFMNRLCPLIEECFPLPRRYRRGSAGPGGKVPPDLAKDVAELSRVFTSARSERDGAYIGKPAFLSAYLRYFLPWNVYRLCRLLPALPLALKDHDAVTDIGSGPLTLALALWMSRPELRRTKLEFRCIDQTGAVLEAGKKLFSALVRPNGQETGQTNGCPWTIKTIRGGLRRNGTLSAVIRGKPAALVAAVNLFNEVAQDISPLDSAALKLFAGKQGRLLSSLTDSSGAVLVAEPGVPSSGELIACLREAFLKQGRPPVSPCTHENACPLPGGRVRRGHGAAGKARWCHFAFDTEDAPPELHRLSAAAGIPKERAVLSFLLAGPVGTPGKQAQGTVLPVRIISDPFPIGAPPRADRGQGKGTDRYGRYGCSEKGLILAAGTRETTEEAESGALMEMDFPLPEKRDTKSGALTGELNLTHIRAEPPGRGKIP
jgi:hypothetical protein